MSHTLRFNAHRLAAVARCVSTEETRYYINGVHFERHPDPAIGGLLAVATDGTKIAVAHDPEGEASPAPLLVRFDPRFLRACAHASDQTVALAEIGGRTVSFTVRPDKEPRHDHPRKIDDAEIIDAQFPGWRRVFRLAGESLPPAEAMARRAGSGWLNTRNLAAFNFPAENGGYRSIALRAISPAGAVFVCRSDAPWFAGAVMPMAVARRARDWAADFLPASLAAAERRVPVGKADQAGKPAPAAAGQ